MVLANADSAMITFPSFPIDLRKSRIPARASACDEANWLLGETLLGLMITRRLPMDWAISCSSDFKARNTLSVRLSPLVSATLLGAAAGALAAAAEAGAA